MNAYKFASAVAALALAGSAAQAQLIIGFDDTSGATTAYEIRVSDGSNVATPLFSSVDVWALASDDANQVLYVGSGTSLYAWTGAGEPSLVGSFTFNGSSQSIVGLAFANGTLYATKNTSNEAVYAVDAATGAMSLAWDYTDGDYDFGGFDYGNGGFYGTNDDSSPFGTGLFSIDVAGGTATHLAAYPSGETDIDGLAVGGGIAYLIEDESGASIHRFDLTTNSYLSAINSPFQTSEVFSAGAYASWIPAPGALGLLGAAGLIAGRRRR
ncbi:MAG TPA: hypothetical protein VFF69_14740 [Phycisphaerales bacterium]|nr:hypothetical protein [Phycisphaerales bacterium]